MKPVTVQRFISIVLSFVFSCAFTVIWIFIFYEIYKHLALPLVHKSLPPNASYVVTLALFALWGPLLLGSVSVTLQNYREMRQSIFVVPEDSSHEADQM